MGEIVGINIIKGVGALFLVFVICFIINVAMTISDKPPMPNMAVVFAWLGTTWAMFYSETGFWRRFVASLLGSIASMIVPASFAILNGVLFSTGPLTEFPILVGIIGAHVTIVTIVPIVQLAAAYFVARAIVRRGFGNSKASRLAAA
jgi:hypothetical protein